MKMLSKMLSDVRETIGWLYGNEIKRIVDRALRLLLRIDPTCDLFDVLLGPAGRRFYGIPWSIRSRKAAFRSLIRRVFWSFAGALRENPKPELRPTVPPERAFMESVSLMD